MAMIFMYVNILHCCCGTWSLC